MKNLTFKTYTFGCRVNQAETTQIENGLIRAGFQPVQENRPCDIVIINTCVVTKKAEKEVNQLARRVRRENPKTFLALAGCGVNFWKKVGLPKIPADLWIKNEEKGRLTEIIKKKLKRLRLQSTIIRCRNIVDKPLTGYQKSNRRIFKIQDGCGRFCSFCIVPSLRGKPKSKKISQIIKEAKEAEKSGIKEIILSGINLGLFGQDTNESIPMLLEALLGNSEIARISFGSIYPEVITDKFINLYANDWKESNGRLARFFHLPLQSGSKKILKHMGRGYNLKKFKTIVEKLYKALPQALIATDVIVGFPGEREKEFQETYKFLKEMPIFKFHIFRFSPRKETLAFKMEKEWGRINEKMKKERAKILKELADKKYNEFLNSLVGTKLQVLIFESKRKEALGIADNSLLVKFPIERHAKDKIVQVLIRDFDFPFLIGNVND